MSLCQCKSSKPINTSWYHAGFQHFSLQLFLQLFVPQNTFHPPPCCCFCCCCCCCCCRCCCLQPPLYLIADACNLLCTSLLLLATSSVPHCCCLQPPLFLIAAACNLLCTSLLLVATSSVPHCCCLQPHLYLIAAYIINTHCSSSFLNNAIIIIHYMLYAMYALPTDL